VLKSHSDKFAGLFAPEPELVPDVCNIAKFFEPEKKLENNTEDKCYTENCHFNNAKSKIY
jgi:hypothetical protein